MVILSNEDAGCLAKTLRVLYSSLPCVIKITYMAQDFKQ